MKVSLPIFRVTSIKFIPCIQEISGGACIRNCVVVLKSRNYGNGGFT